MGIDHPTVGRTVVSREDYGAKELDGRDHSSDTLKGLFIYGRNEGP